jgi:hypothetical protein
MSQLPSREDFLRRKAEERQEIERPLRRAAEEERALAAARTSYWRLLEEFVHRTQELAVAHQTRLAPAQGSTRGQVAWVEGYPLTSGAVVSAPPLRFATRRGGLLLRQTQVHEIEELSLFVVMDGRRAEDGPLRIDRQIASEGSWPPVHRLDKTAEALTALKRELEASLLLLME